MVCFLEYSYGHKIEDNNNISTELSVSALSKETLNLGSNKTGNNDKWVTDTTAWRVRRLRMEERPPIRKVAAIILSKQSRTANKGWSYSLGFGRDANNSSPQKLVLLRKGYICLRPGLILWYELCNGKGDM